MALLKTVELGGKTLNRVYRVDSCFPFRNMAKMEFVFWYISDEDLAANNYPQPVNGVHVDFDGAEQYVAIDVEEQIDNEGNVVSPAKTSYTDYFSNSVLIAEDNSPFKNAYEYAKTLPEFAGAQDVDL